MSQIIDLGKLRFNFAGDWNVATTYESNDVVRYGGNLYVYTYALSNAGFMPTNVTYWSLMVEGFKFTGVYNSGTSYKVGNGISWGGKVYIAIVDSIGQTPPNATYWSQFVDGIQYEGTYNVATAYQRNDIVTLGSLVFIAKQDTTGNDPTNTTYWDVLTSGTAWRGTWAASTKYYKNDIIKDAVGSAYIATIEHTSTSSFTTDRTGGKWSLYVQGGADILPALPAIPNGLSLSVSNDGSTTTWVGATTSDNVYYVAPHGIDNANHGKNMVAPFASIKYACQNVPAGSTIFVKTGTYNEQLPITVPANTAIVGDNQRTVIIQPKTGNSDDGTTPNAQSTMFYLSDGAILNKMTFKGMTGWVAGTTPADVTTSTIKGVVVRLNPASPILVKSPYVLECSAIGSGCIGALIDGSVHASGAKTMIFHGYTIISDNGIGYWVKDGGKSEIVSCFTYYCYFGYTASGGGFIRALNGNNSYGTWGATSRGYDTSETAVTGSIYGQQLNFLYTSGNISVGDTVTSSSGATATVTNVQISANKLYVTGASGTFTLGNTLTFTSGGTGTVSAGALEDQKGFILILNNLTARPIPGASISIAGDTYSYVVQSVSGSWTNASSVIAVVLAQEKPTGSASGSATTIRYKYSQIRLTGHDFLSIGTGGVTTTNYPGTPTQAAAQGNETDEAYPGRVYYVSTDQDGNFRVGEYFRIDQATGRATLNASAFDLAGLTSLKLGSIGAQLGETINEFSSDVTMSGNSNTAVPTEYAVKTYVDNSIPAQANKVGYFLRSNGTSIYWDTMTQITGTANFAYAPGTAFPTTTYSVTSLTTASPSWTWSLTGAPSGFSIGSSGSNVNLSQSSNLAAGTYNFFINVTDGKFPAKYPVKIVVDAQVPVFSTATPPNAVLVSSGALSYTFTRATATSGTPTHTLLSGALPTFLTLNSSGTLTGTAPTTTALSTTYTFTIRATNGSIIVDKSYSWTFLVGTVQGQALYGTNVGSGTFSWVAPTGVTSVSVVAIGGGKGGSYTWSYGGGAGGGLGWKNAIAVTPGQSYTVVVGAGGAINSTANYYNSDNGYGSTDGGTSYFINQGTVAGQGGGKPSDAVFNSTRYQSNTTGYYGGGYTGDGGGRGGNVGSSWTQPGAGAGGYYGPGGDSGNGVSYQSTYGGGAGDYYSSTYGTGGGGGTGLIGDDGNDRYGTYRYTPFNGYYQSNGNYGGGGGHGPGGNNGYYGENPFSGTRQGGNYNIQGGTYGGGGGGSGSDGAAGGPGAQGGVRIIWGTGRSFPATLTNDQTVISA